MKTLITNSTQKGQIVFEPFMGVGSTCVAAKDLGRKYIGCEIDPTYYEVCEKRLSDEYVALNDAYTSQLW